MTDEPIDYETKYKESDALNKSLETKLSELIDENTKLKADLTVAQMVNKKTVGVSNIPPKSDKVGISINERMAEYKKSLLKKE